MIIITYPDGHKEIMRKMEYRKWEINAYYSIIKIIIGVGISYYLFILLLMLGVYLVQNHII
jgi:hypothetical protein